VAFSYTIDRHGPRVRLVLAGEVDIGACHEIRQAAHRLLSVPAIRCLEVDLGALTLLDSSGIVALVDAYHAAAGRGCAFAVTNAHGVVKAALQTTGVFDILTQAQPASEQPR
jgi:anti-sigma B factor antagonist/stage II sporulation protein AA (anti-sigma F factor antagonist)